LAHHSLDTDLAAPRRPRAAYAASSWRRRRIERFLVRPGSSYPILVSGADGEGVRAPLPVTFSAAASLLSTGPGLQSSPYIIANETNSPGRWWPRHPSTSRCRFEIEPRSVTLAAR